MSIKTRSVYLSLVIVLLLAGSACQPKSPAVAGVNSAPSLAPPPVDTPTAPFLGAIPVDLPAARLDQAGDVDSSRNAYKKVVSGGDVFVNGLYERPFNANTMDKYFPYLDIIGTQGFKDDTWGYATITLAGNDSNGGLPGQYAVELDLDRDGRGDWLILAKSVTGTAWSTKGVQAWQDADKDIGASVPMVAEKKPRGGSGYDKLIFDAGQGTLVDGAWARIHPDDPKTVQIAFKLSMVGDPSAYAMGAWAGTKIDQGMFDFNDAMTHAQAGSPLASYAVYPLKALAEIDNTCRLAIGFAPTGKEPGLCATVQKNQSDCVPPPCPPTGAMCPNPCAP